MADDDACDLEAARDDGATIAIVALARILRVTGWKGGDGTETFEGDVEKEVVNVLKAARIYDDEDGGIAVHTPAEVTALVAAAREEGRREALNKAIAAAEETAGAEEGEGYDLGMHIAKKIGWLMEEVR